MISKSHLHRVAASALVLVLAGCSSRGAVPESLSFAVQPDMVETGKALRVEVRASPNPPWQGTIAVELTVSNSADGTPQDGLGILLVPWMPAHDHGTSLTPVVTPEGGGKYLVTDVNLFMAGYWELQTSFSGPVTDYVAPGYNVP